MAKKKATKRTKKKTDRRLAGPYLATAVLCENVLEETDNVLSLIRIIDQITVEHGAEDTPHARIAFIAHISFKSGDATGKETLTLAGIAPNGSKLPEQLISIEFKKNHGTVVRANITLDVKTPGIFWFDVLLGGELITRMPLRVSFRRVATGVSS